MKKLQDELLLNKVGRGPEGWTGGEAQRCSLEGRCGGMAWRGGAGELGAWQWNQPSHPWSVPRGTLWGTL